MRLRGLHCCFCLCVRGVTLRVKYVTLKVDLESVLRLIRISFKANFNQP